MSRSFVRLLTFAEAGIESSANLWVYILWRRKMFVRKLVLPPIVSKRNLQSSVKAVAKAIIERHFANSRVKFLISFVASAALPEKRVQKYILLDNHRLCIISLMLLDEFVTFLALVILLDDIYSAYISLLSLMLQLILDICLIK